MEARRVLNGLAAMAIAWLALASTPAFAQSSCAVPGRDGVASISTYPNTIHPGAGSAFAGSTSVSLGARDARGASTNIAAGDLVLIVQMQDASINSTNASSYGGSSNGSGYTSIGSSGLYEYATVAAGSGTVGAGGGTLTLSAPLTNSYSSATATPGQGQRRFQVLRVPQNSTLGLSGTISAPPWDGVTGGVIAIESAGQLNWGGATLDAAGRGFRGGGGQCSTSNGTGVALANTDYRNSFGTGAVNLAGVGNVPGGAKGEGVAGTPILLFEPTAPNNGNAAGTVRWGCAAGTTGTACPAEDGSSAGYPGGTFGRGAPGNGGGGATDGNPATNDQNTGGAGGGNYSSGGHGGYGWTPGVPPGVDGGGFGGASVPSSPSRLFFGGGGGSATANNCTGTPGNGASGSGASGGGMVFVRAGSTTGGGTVNVQGGSANNTITNDASGGGGAGGSALIFVNNNGGSTGATVNASGGNGGSNTGGGSPHGPGGGGSGGYVVLSGPATINVAGGAGGTTAPSASSTIDYGATASSGGVQYVGLTANQIPGAGASPVCFPRITVTKTTATPGTVQGGIATYTITAANQAGYGTAESVRITDVLPNTPNFTFAATNSVTLGGGATRPVALNPTAAATSPVWGDFLIPGGGSVAVSFNVNVAAATPPATYQNPATVDYLDPTRSAAQRAGPGGTYTAGGVVPGTNYVAASTPNEDVTVRSAIAVAKTFNPTSISDNGVSALTITLTNPNAVPITNAAITDNYPAGLENATTPAGATTCAGGSVTAVAGASTVALSGATIPASGSCTITVNVTATLAQTFVNTLPAGSLTSTENATNAAGSGTLLARPRVVKSFSPIAVPQNSDATMSIAITNPNAAQALTLSNPALTDPFPAGLVASGGAVAYTGAGCGAFGPGAIGAGATSFTLSGGTLAAGGTCTASFAVRSATVGSYPNTTSGVTTTQTPNAGNPSNTASLGVGLVNISKAFGTTAPFAVPGRIQLGQSNTLTFTLVNPTGVVQTGSSFTDTLNNMSIAAAPVGGTCAGTTPATLGVGATSLAFSNITVPAGSCTVTVTVTSNTVGAHNNATSGVATSLLPQGPPSNTDTLYAIGPATITKTFSPAAIGPGTMSTLILTLTNPNALALTGLGFTDTYPAGVTNAAPLTVGGTCSGVSTTATAGGGTFNVSVGNLPAGASCTITMVVTGSTPGTYANTTSGVTTTEAAVGPVSNTAQLVVLAPPTLAKAFAPATIGAGGTTTLTFTLTNPNASALTDARFTDTFTNMFIGATGIGGTCVGSFGAPPPAVGDTFIDLRVPSLAAGSSCTVTVTVRSTTTGAHANTANGITTTQTPTAGAPSNTASLSVLATPALAKNFSPGAIQSGATSTLTFTVTNPNGATALTNVGFADTLANMTVSSTTAGGSCTGVTFAPPLSIGGTQINPTVASLAAGASCTITVSVTSSSISSATGHPNTTSGAVSTQTPTVGATATGYLRVLGAPTITKAFVPSAITVNGVSTLVFTLTNPNPVTLTGGRFTDAFPANLAVNNVAQSFIGAGRGTCPTAIPSAMPAGTPPSVAPLSFANIVIPAGSSCTIMIDVTSGTAGSYNNTTSGITTTETPIVGAGSNTSNLRVLAGPTLTQAFVTNPILAGGTTILRFTLTNPNAAAGANLTNVAFTDALANITVASATAGGTCAGVTFAPALTVGGTQINPTVATLANATSCTIDVTVTSSVASPAVGHVNTTTGPVSQEVPAAGAASSASLFVAAPPTFTKSFAPAGVALNTNSTLTFTLTNPNPIALTGVAFTDNFPANLITQDGEVNNCGGTWLDSGGGAIAGGETGVRHTGGTIPANGSCTLTVPVRSATAGTYTNTSSGLTASYDPNGAAAPAAIAVTAPAATDVLSVGQSSIAKAFGAASILLNGTTTLTITVTNNSGAAFTNTLNFIDTFPPGLVVHTTPGFANTCGGTVTSGNTAGQTAVQITNGTRANNGSCTVTVTVRATAAGVLTNTVNGTGPASLAGRSDTQVLQVMAPPTVSKAFSQTVIGPGDTPTLTITLTNPNGVPITGVVATDVFPTAPGAMRVATPLTTTNTCGGALQDSGGAALGVNDVGIRLNAGVIPANSSCSFSVNVSTPATAGTYPNTIAAGGVTTANAGPNAAAASAPVTMVLSNLTKSFAPTSILAGDTATLNLVIGKAGATATQTGIGFTDTLPAGLAIAATPNVQTNCPAGAGFAAPGFTVSAPAGGSAIAVSGASIATGVATCTVRVDVTTSATPAIGACPVAGNTNAAANIGGEANIENLVTPQCLQVAAAVPALTKAFAPASIMTGATTTLTFTVTQPAGNGTQTFSFNDTLPAGLVIAAGAVGGTCAGGTVSAPAGGSTIAVAGRQIAATSCTITVPVTTAATPTVGGCPGTPANTNGPGEISGTSNLGNNVVDQCVTVTPAPATLAKAFAPASIPQGGVATLTFTITNGAGSPAQAAIAFIDNFPPNLFVAGVPNATTTCGAGSVTATAGAASVALAGGTLAAGQASCIVRVDVTSAVTGTRVNNNTNIAGASANLIITGVADTLTVYASASLTKAFNPLAIGPGALSTLTFTLNNGAGNPAQSGLAFADTLAANLVVAATPNVRTNCPAGGALGAVPGGMTVTAAAGSGSISVSGAAINAATISCQVAVDVTSATVGAYPNTSANISGLNGGLTAGGVSSTLSVSGAALVKAFNPAAIGAGSVSQLTFTVTNGTGNPAQAALAFLDTLPAGLVIASPNGLVNGCGGTATAVPGSGSVQLAAGALGAGVASCTLQVNVTAVNPATYTNAAGNVSGASANLNVSGVNASLDVVRATLTKAFAPASITVGGTSVLTFTLANGAGNPAQSGIAFTDTLPAGLRVAATPGIASTCPSGVAAVSAVAGGNTITVTNATMNAAQVSCTISVNVTHVAAPTVGACPVANNTNGAANVSATANVTNGVTGQCLAVTAAVPSLDKAWSAGLTVGATATLTFTMSQPAGNPTQTFGFTDTLPAGLVVSSTGVVGGTCSGGTVTATAGSNTITVASRQIVNPATSCTITIPVTTANTPTVATCPAPNNTNANAQISAITNITPAIAATAVGGGTSAAGACVSVAAAVPTFDKTFSAGLTVGGTSTLTFTVAQPAGNPTQTFSFIDNLPPGLAVGAGAVGGTCSGGSVTATAGASTITITNRQIVNPATSCTITVPITTSAIPTAASCPAANNTNAAAQIAGATNITAAIGASAAGGGTSPAGACVSVTAAVPSLNKAFSAGLTVGGSSTLTFTVTQPAGNPTQTFSFTDNLPAGLVIGSGAVGGSCSGGTITATAGASTITVANRQIVNPATSCTITVPVTTAPTPTLGSCPVAANTNASAQIAGATNLTVAIGASAAGGGTSPAGACVSVTAAVPALDKAFSAGLTVGTSNTLTFTVTQPAGNPTQAFSFTDNLPAGLVVGSGAVGGTCSGGTVTATTGATTITVANRQIVNPATSCTITVPITTSLTPTVASCPAAGNTNGNAAIATPSNITAAVANSAAGGGTSTTGACVSVTAAVPTLDKVFSGGLVVGGATTLTFTVAQPAGNPTQTFSFTDNLPAGLVVGSGAIGGSCSGGTVTATPGTATITVANRQIVNPATSCTITVPITTATAPTVAACPAVGNTNANAQIAGAGNITAAIAASAAGGGNSPAGACVTVIPAVPGLVKAFAPSSIALGGTTALTFTVTQPTGNPTQTFSFTDVLPAGLAVAAGAVGGTCTGGTVTAAAGSSTISVAGRQIVNPATSCTITVPVTTSATPNTTACPVLANTNGNANLQAPSPTNITNNVADQCVTVYAPPTLAKSFTPATIGVGLPTTLRLTLGNPALNSAALTGVAASDPLGTFNLSLASPVGVTFTPAACGTLQSRATVGSGAFGSVTPGHAEIRLDVATLAPGASCQVDVNVTSTTPGAATNVTASPTAAGPVALTGTPASATLTVARAGLTKAFAPGAITVGGSTVLTFTLTNGAGNPAHSGIAFTDTLSSGLRIAATPGIATTCPSGVGAVAATAGGTTITVTNASMNAGQASCTIAVNVTHAAAPTLGACPQPNNTNGPANVSAATGLTNNVTDQCLAVNAATPALDKAFSGSLTVGATATLTFTVTQPAGNPASTFSFTDTLPSGLAVAAGGTAGTCTAGSLVATAGTNTITVSNYQIAGGSTSCTITVPVTSSSTPSVGACPVAANTNGNAQVSGAAGIVAAIGNSAAGGGSSTTGACVTVIPATPALTKAFAPSAISVGGIATLTFTITQSATNPTSSFSFTDTLPAGLAVGSGAIGGSCTGGSVSAVVGGNSISVTNRQIVNPSTSCTITVPVTTSATPSSATCPAANNTNGAANISATTNVINSVTSQCVTVYSPPTIAKAFSPASIAYGATSTITFTLGNNNAIALTGGQFTDTLANMTVSGAQAAGGTCAGASGNNFANGATALAFSGLTIPASSSCTVTVVVTSSTVGTHPNQASGVFTNEVAVGPASAVANLTVAATAPTIAKQFLVSPIDSGQVSTLRITVTNPNAAAITVTSLTDSFPTSAGGGQLQRAPTPNIATSGSCGAATVSSTNTSVTLNNAIIPGSSACTFQIDVTAATSGSYVNTIAAGTLNSSAGSNTAAASATLVVNPVANVGVSKLGPATVGTGGSIVYTIAITNSGPDAANGTTFTDTVPGQVSGLVATCGSPSGAAVCGTVSIAGNTVTTTVPTLPAGGSVSINISGTAQGIGTITNTASVTPPAATTDPVAANNSSSVSTTILAPDLTVAKTHSGNFTVGVNGTYTVVVTNQAGSMPTAGAINVVDSLPAGLGFVSASGSGWVCGFSAPTVSCTTNAVIAAGSASNPITLVVAVGSTAAPSVTNAATVSGGGEPTATIGNNTAYDFTLVGGSAMNTFAPDGTQSSMPGTVVFYPHTFTAGSAGSVAFSTSAIQVPAVGGWTQIVYRDSNCSGGLDGAEGNSPLAAPVAVAAGDTVCIVVKDSIPGTAPYNARNLISVVATSNAATTLTRTDTTIVGSVAGAGLTLAKAVRNVTLGGASGTSNTARPNDILEYSITYTNTSSGLLSTIVITDATPAFTLYQSAGCTLPAPGNITSCAVTAQPAANGAGSIVWTLGGSLLSGGSGTVTYQVRVAP